MRMLGTVLYVVQVKIIGQGLYKWQFELQLSTEMDWDERHAVVHKYAERAAGRNRGLGDWPEEGDLLVWYAELGPNNKVENEVPWHSLNPYGSN